MNVIPGKPADYRPVNDGRPNHYRRFVDEEPTDDILVTRAGQTVEQAFAEPEFEFDRIGSGSSRPRGAGRRHARRQGRRNRRAHRRRCRAENRCRPRDGAPQTGRTRMTFPTDEIVVTQDGASGDEVFVHMKGSATDSDAYIQYRMQNYPIPARRADVIRISGVHRSRRTSGMTMVKNVEEIVAAGAEWELAIKQAGKADFMGGNAHGNEQKTTMLMLIDGQAVPFAGSGAFVCRSVDFYQKSVLYEVGSDPANALANVAKRWRFGDRKLILQTHVEWLAAVALDNAYLAMVPIERLNPGNVQITDTAVRSPAWTVEDIATAGFQTTTDQSDHFVAWGPNGYSVDVEVVDGWERPTRAATVSNSSLYNKIYFDFARNDTVSVGEQMTSRWQSRINYDG